MREWQVLKNGKVWNDRFNSEDLAYDNMEECIKEDTNSRNVYEVTEMTKEEIETYN